MQNNNTYAKQSDKRKKSQQKATAIFNKKNYKNISIRVKPDQADEIRATAENLHLSLAQLIINAVRAYADIQTAGADPAQPEQDPTESPIESGETAGAQPEEETENEIETEEETAEEEEQTAGAETTEEEEPQEDEDEDEDEKPEDIPAFVWEQIQRLKKADKRHTAERKAREATERKRRRLSEETEDC